jgi:hypothetical protein
VGNSCPPDALAVNGTPCRPAAGVCDAVETCDGTSVTCPPDQKRTGDCRPAAGPCDVTERCDGISDTCPADRVVAAGSTCRAAAGACDVAETCDGANITCPADSFVAAGTTCRPAASSCDVVESCTGTSASCPPDTNGPDADRDGVCDPQDDCPGTADPAQGDADGDGIGDACDPCTRTDAGAMTARALRVKGLKSGKGEQTLTFHGTMTVPTTPEIDPVARGVRVLITTAAGDVVVDVTIPGGGGWKTNRVRTLWSYHGGAGGRIREVTMRRNRSAPGTIRFTVSGKGANLAPPDGTPIIATIVLDAPFATTGQCGEADFGSCKKSKSGKALVCS